MIGKAHITSWCYNPIFAGTPWKTNMEPKVMKVWRIFLSNWVTGNRFHVARNFNACFFVWAPFSLQIFRHNILTIQMRVSKKGWHFSRYFLSKLEAFQKPWGMDCGPKSLNLNVRWKSQNKSCYNPSSQLCLISDTIRKKKYTEMMNEFVGKKVDQVIQFVAFLSHSWRSPTTLEFGSREFTMPKRSPAESTGSCLCHFSSTPEAWSCLRAK